MDAAGRQILVARTLAHHRTLAQYRGASAALLLPLHVLHPAPRVVRMIRRRGVRQIRTLSELLRACNQQEHRGARLYACEEIDFMSLSLISVVALLQNTTILGELLISFACCIHRYPSNRSHKTSRIVITVFSAESTARAYAMISRAVGIHGADLANAYFLPPNATVVEIIGEHFASYPTCEPAWRIERPFFSPPMPSSASRCCPVCAV